MKLLEQKDKTIMITDKDYGFVYLAQQAILIASRRCVPTEFEYQGCTVTVHGNDKVTQVYSDFLKNHTRKTASCPMRRI